MANRPFTPQSKENEMADTNTADAASGEWSDSTAGSPGAGSTSATSSEPIFQQLSAEGEGPGGRNDIDLILDIPVQLTVELGRTRITIKNLLQLAQGSVVELDGLAGEPMDVLVNGYLIAQGEVVIVNDKFGIRLTDIVTPSERMRKLNR